jgi:hypothetical protein
MSNRHLLLFGGSIVWLGAATLLAARGVFVTGAGQLPLVLALAFLMPIVLFLLALRLSATWRALVGSIPPVFLIALNGWRFIGLGFLMAWAEGMLPGGFAWPAGLGDIAMAATAPWILARVVANDGFRFGKTFLVWNLFGIADFIDAVFLGMLYLWPGFTTGANTALMQRLPFALIPAFFVPLVAMAHFTLLLQRS